MCIVSAARAEEKASADRQQERLARMFAALSATNEAIMRAKSRAELFKLVCEAAVVGGDFTSTAVVLKKPGEEFLEIVTSGKSGRSRSRTAPIDIPASAGVSGAVTSFRALRCRHRPWDRSRTPGEIFRSEPRRRLPGQRNRRAPG